MAKISVQELAKAISAKHGLTQTDAEDFVSAMFDVINNGLHADKAVKVKGIGTFKVIDVRERESVNVNTGERVTIESHGKITYTPDPILRDLVNKPFAKFETVILNDGLSVDELNKIGASEIEESQDVEDEQETVEETEQTSEFTIFNKKVENNALTPVAEESVEEEIDADETENIPSEPIAESIENSEETPSDIVEESEEQEVVADDKPQEEADETEQVVVAVNEKTKDEAAENEKTKDEAAVVEETEEDETPLFDEDDYEEESFFKRRPWFVFTICLVIVAVVSFAGGYLVGQSMSSRAVFKTINVVKSEMPKVAADTATVMDTATIKEVFKEEAKADTLKKAETKEQAKTDVKETAVKKETMEEKAEPKKEEKTEVDEGKALRQANAIVRTGAYTIIGTDRTVTVRKGQTMKQISKSYLGEGMECYVQIHNGVAEVTEGMKIKIPKLKLKKK